MRPKTINRPVTNIADNQLSVKLLEESGNTTNNLTINSTDRQLTTKSDKTNVECRYSTDEWDADARAVAGSTAGSSATDLIKAGLTDSACMRSVQKLMQIRTSTIAAKE